MKEYCVVGKTYKDDFEKEVNKRLSEGWELQGNLQSNRTSHGVEWYAQAMTRDKNRFKSQDSQK